MSHLFLKKVYDKNTLKSVMHLIKLVYLFVCFPFSIVFSGRNQMGCRGEDEPFCPAQTANMITHCLGRRQWATCASILLSSHRGLRNVHNCNPLKFKNNTKLSMWEPDARLLPFCKSDVLAADSCWKQCEFAPNLCALCKVLTIF